MSYDVKYCYVNSADIDNSLLPDAGRIEKLNKVNGFFIHLKESMIKEGVRNPVVLTATSESITPRYGGSRIMVAQELGIKIPAIIADFDNIFPDAEVLTTIAQIESKFIDRPAAIRLKPYGINVSGCKHVHLKEKK